MADPFRKRQPGDRGGVPSPAWNVMLDAARAHQRQQQGKKGGGPLPFDLRGKLDVLIRNDSGGDLAAFSVLAITGSVLNPATTPHAVVRTPTLTGDTPAATTDAVAVLTEACGDGLLGRAVVMGVVPAVVEVTDSGHGYAEPTPADTSKLTSAAAAGPIRILHTPGGTGTLHCVVLLQSWGGGGVEAEITYLSGACLVDGVLKVERTTRTVLVPAAAPDPVAVCIEDPACPESCELPAGCDVDFYSLPDELPFEVISAPACLAHMGSLTGVFVRSGLLANAYFTDLVHTSVPTIELSLQCNACEPLVGEYSGYVLGLTGSLSSTCLDPNLLPDEFGCAVAVAVSGTNSPFSRVFAVPACWFNDGGGSSSDPACDPAEKVYILVTE